MTSETGVAVQPSTRYVDAETAVANELRELALSDKREPTSARCLCRYGLQGEYVHIQALGSIAGKALVPLDGGRGLIPILLPLQ